MGTPDRFTKVENDLVSGKVARLNRSKKQKTVFLDRDGVINKEVNQLTNIEDFELIDGAIEAIKSLNKSDYIVIVIRFPDIREFKFQLLIAWNAINFFNR